MALTIDSKAIIEKFINNFDKELKGALENWKQDVEKFSSELINNLGEPKADYNKIVYISNRMIEIYFKANPTLLADIYGTGSKMLDNINPMFQSYWMERGPNEGQVNPARTSKNIQGRPKGTYTNIFGKTRTSSGNSEGKNLEGKGINPIEPNKELLDKYFGTAIEIADKFFKTTYLENAIKKSIDNIKFSDYINKRG